MPQIPCHRFRATLMTAATMTIATVTSLNVTSIGIIPGSLVAESFIREDLQRTGRRFPVLQQPQWRCKPADTSRDFVQPPAEFSPPAAAVLRQQGDNRMPTAGAYQKTGLWGSACGRNSGSLPQVRTGVTGRICVFSVLRKPSCPIPLMLQASFLSGPRNGTSAAQPADQRDRYCRRLRDGGIR